MNASVDVERAPKTITEVLEKRWVMEILAQEKVVEGRKASTLRYQDLKVNDVLHFVTEDMKIQAWCKVTKINKYMPLEIVDSSTGENETVLHAIETCLRAETLPRILPGVGTIEEGVKIYCSPPMSWNNDEVDRCGMLGIQIELTDTKFKL